MSLLNRVASRYLTGKLQRLTVYRIDEKHHGILRNRNAANLAGIVTYIADECDDYSLHFCLPTAIITEYKIVVEGGFGLYTAFRGGKPVVSSPNAQKVGKARGSWDKAIWYSFPTVAEGLTGEDGRWELVRVGRKVRVTDLPNDLTEQGSVEQLKILQSYFR